MAASVQHGGGGGSTVAFFSGEDWSSWMVTVSRWDWRLSGFK